jgi:release factor glutamine methyltransferase
LLGSVTDVPQLEAEILLAHILKVKRSYLHTWPDKIIESVEQKNFLELIAKRCQGEPIAYLIGHREFWTLDLMVTPDVLIPRPDTELLVDSVLKNIVNEEAVVADLGTGSGAIALSLAQARPHWSVYATDMSMSALLVAKDNGKRLGIKNVIFQQGSWCEALPDIKFHAIVSNPPYIAEDDDHLNTGDLRFEPRSALASGSDGLRDITEIIFQVKNYLLPSGMLFLEHGFQQAQSVASIFAKAGYTNITTCQDLSGLDRMTMASWTSLK